MNCFTKYIALFFVFSFFTGCSFVSEKLEENSCENILFLLPEWPEDEFPALSRWLVEIESQTISQKFYTNESKISLTVRENQPLCIVATPVTLIKNSEKETQFFYPAGNIYPFFWEEPSDQMDNNLDGKISLTWNGRFTASVMKSIFKSRLETGVTAQHINDFIDSFNWQKIQESIENQIIAGINSYRKKDDSSETETAQKPQFYNPWLIDKEVLLENLSNAIFNTTYLNVKNILSVPLENLKLENVSSLYVPFVPENMILQENQIVTVQKNKTSSLMANETFSIQVKCSSIKNVSVQTLYLPILIDDYET